MRTPTAAKPEVAAQAVGAREGALGLATATLGFGLAAPAPGAWVSAVVVDAPGVSRVPAVWRAT